MSENIAELLQRAPVPAMTIDPYAVLHRSKRRRLKRRVANAGLVAALVAAVAVTGMQSAWWQPEQTRVANRAAVSQVNLTVAGTAGATRTLRAIVEPSTTRPTVVRLLVNEPGNRWQDLVTLPAPERGGARVAASTTGGSVAFIVANAPAKDRVTLTLSDGTQAQRTLVSVPGSSYAVAVVDGLDLSNLQGPMTVTVQ